MKASDRYLVDGATCRLDGLELPVSNLSVGGLFVAADRLPMKGQVLGLELALGGRPPFRILGKVTWVNDVDQPVASDLPRGFGVKITEIAFPDKIALVNALKLSGRHSRGGD
jgi:hypothetical protein